MLFAYYVSLYRYLNSMTSRRMDGSFGTPKIYKNTLSHRDQRTKNLTNDVYLKQSVRQNQNALYRSFVEQQNLRKERANQLGIAHNTKPDQSFEINQSFPKSKGTTESNKLGLWSAQLFSLESTPKQITTSKRVKTDSKVRQLADFDGKECGSVSFGTYRRLGRVASVSSLLCTTWPQDIMESGRSTGDLSSRSSIFSLSYPAAKSKCVGGLPKVKGNAVFTVNLKTKEVEVLDSCGSIIPVSVWSYPVNKSPVSTRHNSVSATICVKRSSNGKRSLIVLEPVERIQAQCVLGPDGMIFSADDSLAHLFGYGHGSDMLGQNVNEFFPSMEIDSCEPAVVDHCVAVAKDSTKFPVTTKLVALKDEEANEVLKYDLTVYCYTTISGVVTFLSDGTLHSFNGHFVKTLLGFNADELKGKSITDLIPTFYRDLMSIDHDDMPLPPLDDLTNDSMHHQQEMPLSPICSRMAELKLDAGVWDDDGNVQLDLLTSTPATTTSRVKEGSFYGYAKHKKDDLIAINYHVQKVILKDGTLLFTIAIGRHHHPFSLPTTQPTSGDVDRRSETDGDEISFSADQSCDLSLVTAGDYAEKYEVLEHIGKGAFGSVKLAVNKKDQTMVITKFICKSRILVDSWVADEKWSSGSVPIEVHLLTKLNHPNIVKVLDVFENDNFYQLVMEKHGRGMDLFDFIDRQPYLDEQLISYMLRQIVSAVAHLHRLKIVHRDIKDENVIIDERFRCKLIDFGSAAYFGDGKVFSTFCGTIEYCSPEVLSGNKYSGPELEMWSIGILLYTLVFGENPFRSAEETVTCDLDMPWPVSEGLHQLISWLLHPVPQCRATIKEIQQHWWLTQKVIIENYRFDKVLPNLVDSRRNSSE